MGQKPRFWPNS